MRSIPYSQARFLISIPDARGAPPDQGFEVAFAGRSNSGKSSAINAVVGRRALARTSKTPGRTQHIIFFEVDSQRRLVDLPGYGYARVPKDMQRRWQHSMSTFLQNRQVLRGLLLIMDIRHPLKDQDFQMLDWTQHAGLPLHILLTKADKLKRGPAKQQLQRVAQELNSQGYLATVQLFSATHGTGVAQAREQLDEWLGADEDDNFSEPSL